MKRRRPHRHYRTINTKKGRKMILVNKHIKKRKKRRASVASRLVDNKIIDTHPEVIIMEKKYHDLRKSQNLPKSNFKAKDLIPGTKDNLNKLIHKFKSADQEKRQKPLKYDLLRHTIQRNIDMRRSLKDRVLSGKHIIPEDIELEELYTKISQRLVNKGETDRSIQKKLSRDYPVKVPDFQRHLESANKLNLQIQSQKKDIDKINKKIHDFVYMIDEPSDDDDIKFKQIEKLDKSLSKKYDRLNRLKHALEEEKMFLKGKMYGPPNIKRIFSPEEDSKYMDRPTQEEMRTW